MRIAYIYPALTTVGGADRVISEKANYFADVFGYEVFIITAHQNNKPLSFPLSPKVTHIDLDVNFNLQYKYGFFKRGYIYFQLLSKYKKRLTATLFNLCPDITLTTISRDVDILTNIKDGSIKVAEAHVAKRFIRNNHLLQQKGGLYKVVGKIWNRKMEKAIVKFSELVVLTQNDANEWKRHNRTSTVIPNALPFYPSAQSNCISKTVMSVGRLEEQKGYDFLIDAWKIVAKKFPEWTLKIYGEGSLYKQLTNQITAANLQENIKIMEPVNNITDHYLQSSIFVLSSRFEGFGMVLIEAMACGVPVVSFDCPHGPSDIIKNDVDGYIVSNGDIYQLAEKICFLIENKNLRIEMGQQARQNVTRYNREVIMNEWDKLFKRLFQNRVD